MILVPQFVYVHVACQIEVFSAYAPCGTLKVHNRTIDMRFAELVKVHNRMIKLYRRVL